MTFPDADLTAMLIATGEDIEIVLSGVVITTIRAKFRRDVEVFEPFNGGVVNYKPGLLIKTSDMTDITSSHKFRRAGVDYSQFGAQQERNDGFTQVILTK